MESSSGLVVIGSIQRSGDGDQAAGDRVGVNDAEQGLAGTGEVAGDADKPRLAQRFTGGQVNDRWRSVPRNLDKLAGHGIDGDAGGVGDHLVERELAGVAGRAELGVGRQDQVGDRGAGSARGNACVDHELHDLAGGVRIGDVEGIEAGEGAVAGGVDDADAGAVGDAGKVDDDVGTLGRHEQHGLDVTRVRRDGRQRLAGDQLGHDAGLDHGDLGQEALVAADLEEGDLLAEDIVGGVVDEVGAGAVDDEHGEVEGSRVTAVQQAEAVTLGGDLEARPGDAVDDEGVEEGFGVPDLGDVGAAIGRLGSPR